MEAEIIGASIGAIAAIVAALISRNRGRQSRQQLPLPSSPVLPRPSDAQVVRSDVRAQESGPEFMSDEYLTTLAVNLQLHAEEGDHLRLSDTPGSPGAGGGS